jgi:ribonuclease Z
VIPGHTFELGRNLGLRVVYSSHIPVEGKSVGYIVERLFRKLKTEYAGLPQDDIEKLGRELGSEALTEPRTEPILGYSGDTGPCPIDQWKGCKLLIHEATFLHADDVESERAGYEHSTLPEVVEMAHNSDVEQLVLSHFSSRYPKSEIVASIQDLCARFETPMRVSALLPGETVRDLLARPPLWPRQS